MVFSFITLVHSKELFPAMEFVSTHPAMHIHLLVFSVCSTVGQLFIFQTIRSFGAMVFALIMNTRILVSIALSVICYSHTVSPPGFIGLVLVFSSLLYRVRRKGAQGSETSAESREQERLVGRQLLWEIHEQLEV